WIALNTASRKSIIETKLTNLEFNNISSTNSSSHIAMLIKDALEIESKKNNAVLFGLPEINGLDDIEAVQQFIGNQDENSTSISPDNIVQGFRDGPKYDGKPCFLKVVCTNLQAKHAFIKLINNAHGTPKNDGDDRLCARPDLSYLQRGASRKLQAKLKTGLDNGETGLYINYKAITVISTTLKFFGKILPFPSTDILNFFGKQLRDLVLNKPKRFILVNFRRSKPQNFSPVMNVKKEVLENEKADVLNQYFANTFVHNNKTLPNLDKNPNCPQTQDSVMTEQGIISCPELRQPYPSLEPRQLPQSNGDAHGINFGMGEKVGADDELILCIIIEDNTFEGLVAKFGYHVYDDGSVSLDDGAVGHSDLPPNRQSQHFVVEGTFH
uniref:Uncharacterized protein n=1 Tax=Romanomermis culicivorax TaxID=13658 RepID=A0A915IV25_ROMCU